MSGQHARIRPSALSLTVACEASVQLQESVPPLPETDDQALGHAGHWVARRRLAGFGHELPVGAKFTYNGKEWVVDDDMFSGAALYERSIGGIHPDLHIEEWLQSQRIHRTECAGTPDVWRYFPDARAAYTMCPPGLPPDRFVRGELKIVRVGDYKYGHRFVEVFENFQGIGYIAAVADKLGLNDLDDTLYFEFILVQPRSYHKEGPVRIWRGTLVMLRALINIANGKAERALSSDPQMTTGKHCIDCEARHVCGAAQMNSNSIVSYTQRYERVELTPNQLGQELKLIDEMIDVLKARQTGLAPQAEVLLRKGERVPFYHLEAGQSNLTYFENVDADELVSMGDLIGVNIRKELKRSDRIVTPTQAIQLGIDPDVMNHYANRPHGKMKLTRDNSITAKKVFSK